MVASRTVVAAYAVLVAALAACTSEPPDEAAGVSATGVSHEQQIREMAEEFGVTDPPEVEVVREVSPDESVIVVAACMEDAGWHSEVVDGAAGYDYRAEPAAR